MTFSLSASDQTLIDLALNEDLQLPFQDLTTQYLFPQATEMMLQTHIISKHPEPITICGLPLIEAVLQRFPGRAQIKSIYQDGDCLLPGETLCQIIGPAQTLLMAERTLLNFLQRLCAVATLTQKFVAQVKDTPLKILDTRKTTPGFRHLQKYAVQCGGGLNHRMGLYDAIMVKDTHIDALGGMKEALALLPENPTCPVIIEVRDEDELSQVLAEPNKKITRVLLDNMPLPLMTTCVKHCKGKLLTEASGNMNLDTIRAIADTGVDFASVGKLTHSAGSVDLSMKSL